MEILVEDPRKDCLDPQNPWGAVKVVKVGGVVLKAQYPPMEDIRPYCDFPETGASTAAEALERVDLELHKVAESRGIDLLADVVNIHAA